MHTIDPGHDQSEQWARLLVEFREELVSEGLAPRSVDEYVRMTRRFLRWCDHRVTTPLTITPSDVQAFGETLPYTRSSRKNAYTSVHRLMVALEREDPVWNAIRVPRKPGRRTKALEPDQARTLRNTARMVGGREGLATLIGLYTAARRSEIAAMRWDNVDLTGGWISWYRPKNGDTLDLPIHPVLAELFEFYPRTGDHLFPGNNGRAHVAPNTIWQWIRNVGALAGLDAGLYPHKLRHTALATALDATKDLRAVQSLAGHSDPSVTAGYTRTTEKRLRAAVLAIDAYDALDDDDDGEGGRTWTT